MLIKLINIIKTYIIPIGGGISIIAGGIMFVYSKGINAERAATHNISLEMKVDKLIASDSIRTVKMDTIYFSQKRMIRKMTSIGNTVGIVKTQLGNHIIKTSNDKQDIIDWFNAIEEKKNSSIYYPTQ
jgi:hypothetical protein